MRDQAKYEEAVWRWFFSKAEQQSAYFTRDGAYTPGVKDHIQECGIRPGCWLPDVGTISEFVDTFTGTSNVPAIVADGWICKCGEYGANFIIREPKGSKHQWSQPRHVISGLTVDTRTTLEEVILGVIAKAEEAAQEGP